MKNLTIGIIQTIKLDQEIVDADRSIYFSIYDELGNKIKDSEGNELYNILMGYDVDLGKYKKQITINNDTVQGTVRIYFVSSEVSIEQDYLPEYYELLPGIIHPIAELVSPQYFEEFYLTIESKLRENHKKAFQKYLEDKNGVKDQIASAQSQLEIDCELYFSTRHLKEKRDYSGIEPFKDNFWLIEVRNPPIIELEKVELYFGQMEIIEFDKDWFTINEDLGTLEFLPFQESSGGTLYTMMYTKLITVNVQLMFNGRLSRIPNFFHIYYKTGIYEKGDLLLRKNIKNAIARRALLNVLPIIDPAARDKGGSSSIDGVSGSKNYDTDSIWNKLEKLDTSFIRDIKKLYAKNTNMVII